MLDVLIEEGIHASSSFQIIVLLVNASRHLWSRQVKTHMGQVTELRLSCYLVLLSIDSKTR